MPATLPYTYVAITRITPDTGPAIGGQAVTITGYGFDAATGVTFDTVAATSVVIVSNTTITCVTPPHNSGAVTVTVNGVTALANAYTYTLTAGELLPPIPYRVPVLQQGGLMEISSWGRWFSTVKTRIESAVTNTTSIPAEMIVGVLELDTIPTLPWSHVSKSGSSLADLSTRSAADLTSGVLRVSQGGSGSAVGIAFGAFDPGTYTIPAASFALFPEYVTLGANETLTVGAGSVVRVF